MARRSSDVFIFALAACWGCGGASSSGVVATGQVVAPAGFAASLAGLSVLPPYGSAPVTADGRFEVAMEGLAGVDLVAEDGRLLMIGVAGGDAPGEISADTTAASLLAIALGVALLPPDDAMAARAHRRPRPGHPRRARHDPERRRPLAQPRRGRPGRVRQLRRR